MDTSQDGWGPETGEEFCRLAAAALDDLLRYNPEWATSLGDHRFDDRLDDLSEEGLRSASALYREHRGRLASLDAGLLNAEDRVDLAMLQCELERREFLAGDLERYRWDPLAYNPGEAIYPLTSRDVLPLPDRLRAIAARLEGFPDRLEAARRQLEAPPLVHVETALKQHRGTVALVEEEVGRLLEQEPSMRALVEPAQRRALEALAGFEAALQELRNGPHRSPRIGPQLYERKLALQLASPMAPEAVLSSAQAWMAEVEEALQAAAVAYLTSVGAERAGGVRAALDLLAGDHPDDPTLLPSIQTALQRCTEAVRSTGVVSLPDQPMRVELMPSFRRGVGGAYCDAAGPLEEGGETSFAIEPTPGDWNAEQRASFYREYNHTMLTDLTAHEAMPGHMVQLAHARRFEGSTLVRKVAESGTFVEGWAVHAERLLAESGELGYGVRLQQLKMQLRVAANAVIDVSVHAGDMSEAQALHLMMDRCHQEESEARNKWRRACLTSAQLSTYFVGYAELAELFRRLGSPRKYDEVLAHGCPPPSHLANLLLLDGP